MTEAELIEIARDAMIVTLKVSAPALIGGLVVGLIVSLFQAVTQIQEQTLTFVPKVLTIFLMLLLFFPFMMHALMDFTRGVMDRMVAGG
ncbi:MAG TPA: flagellar biosynthesis protein FliQ [Candidatus Sulfotelmatobacter sp.]|jgi:flagellar biosynthetic protein FliQ|nr:flagellar biosynthesis protein FliQ [Candidatus Sulfotelmatobacter sp.]